MINYEKHPISAAEDSRLVQWIRSEMAGYFMDRARDQMHVHLLDAVNIRSKPAETAMDRAKLEAQANIFEDQAATMRQFIEVFNNLSSPDAEFFKLKINT